MYSNNLLNFQESTTILNACTKKSENLLKAPRLYLSDRLHRALNTLKDSLPEVLSWVKWKSREYRVPIHCHYSQVYSDPELLYLLVSQIDRFWTMFKMILNYIYSKTTDIAVYNMTQ